MESEHFADAACFRKREIQALGIVRVIEPRARRNGRDDGVHRALMGKGIAHVPMQVRNAGCQVRGYSERIRRKRQDMAKSALDVMSQCLDDYCVIFDKNDGEGTTLQTGRAIGQKGGQRPMHRHGITALT